MPTRTALLRLPAAMAALCCAITGPVTPERDRDVARSAVQDLVSERTVPGAAELSQDAHGTVRFVAAGVADVRTGRPIGPDDRFRAGSVTKTFIATVVLQLAAENRIDLDEPVAGRLPARTAAALRNSEETAHVTVRQLLTHTSGLFSYTDDPAFFRAFFGPGFTAHRYDSHTPDALVRTALAHPPYGPPGAGYHYSNTDYVLLGMLIRQVTGHSYAHEIRRRVIEPLHLTGTSFPGDRPVLPAPHGRAYSPVRNGGTSRLADVTDLNPSAAGAAGEMVSTLTDLNRFLGALLGGALLPPGQLRAMRDTTASGGRYGMGLFPVQLPCRRTVWGHNGEINGSYVEVLGTADGRHLLSYRLNSDARPGPAAESRVVAAEFCG
ncbi:D-alanyl-D-alanine carboxypeptidase [Streptomyces mashuensis]|uniref:D-alanyl-D-alanine carboxypeptidase n=1 Tax=Streptomyces mashuensis TaxID=33904 RepID=A0A919B5V3_9ACTN|nr:serine hydrolase domain-containing protein [Streptomyces mashuensis]GHF57836.1 D-alanyl-D-alanine carboxypeptidase [Streptomyces mashuensis]